MNIDKLKSLLAAATPGPWTAEQRSIACGKNPTIENLSYARSSGLGGYIKESRAPDRGAINAVDLALIVAMRNCLPELIRVVEATQALSNAGLVRSYHWEDLNAALAELEKRLEQV